MMKIGQQVIGKDRGKRLRRCGYLDKSGRNVHCGYLQKPAASTTNPSTSLFSMPLRVAFQDQFAGYENGVFFTVLTTVAGGTVEVTSPNKADLIIIGPFSRRKRKLRRTLDKFGIGGEHRSSGALRLFHCFENMRDDGVTADYRITSELRPHSDRYFRLPAWVGTIDWKHEGFHNKPGPRVEKLLDIEQLMRPLGPALLQRPRRAALVTTHMREPRRTLFDTLTRIMPTQGFGRPFDPSIRGHNDSGFAKDIVLRDFAVNLCPENSLYPGYYTEKIIDAYGAGCLPVTWTDPNVRVDFNPKAFVNALDFAATGYEEGLRGALAPEKMAEYAEHPLFLEAPSIEPLAEFLGRVIADAR
jgi:hypothetical protein